MHGSTMTGRALATALGVVSASGALFILMKEDVVAGRWSDNFVLVPIMIVIALAAGHLAVTALRSRKIFTAIGFTLAFVLGTALTVYQSVGKQAETSDSRVLDTEASNHARRITEDDLSRARLRLIQASEQADRETGTGSGCKQKCEDWKLRAREVAAQVRELEAKLKSMNPQQPVAADAERVAKVIHMLTGADENRTKAILVLVKPFAFSLLFELTAIVSLSFAFGHRPVQPAVRTAKTQKTPTQPEPPGGDRRDPRIVSWCEAYARRHGRRPSIPEVQSAFGVGKTSAWRYARSRHGTA